MKTIGFIGLGKMGGGICNKLIESGYSVSVYDTDRQLLDAYEGRSRIANEVEDLLEQDLIFLSLPGSVQVEKVVEQFLARGVAGKTIIDLSTSFPLSSQKLYESVKEAGGNFADCSLTGSPQHAKEGTLQVTFGGDQEVLEHNRQEITCFTRAIHYIGGPGTGNIAKLVNNYLAIMYIGLYAEIFPLVEKMGVDANKLYNIIGNSGVDCPIYRGAGAKIVNQTYEPSFSVNLALKDIEYVKRIYDEFQAPSSLLDGGLKLFRTAADDGLGNQDISEAAKVVRGYLDMK